MKRLLLIITGITVVTCAHAQSSGEKTMEARLLKLLKIKHDLEKPAANGKVKRAFSKTDYVNYADSLKKDPAVLEYLNKTVKEEEKAFSKRYLEYNYAAPHVSIRRKSNVVSYWEYYRVVKYSLFEKGADTLLPLKEVPFMAAKVKDQQSADAAHSAEVLEYLKKRQAEKNR